MQIVINKDFGGYGLSDACIKRYAEIKGITLYPESEDDSYYTIWWTIPESVRLKKKKTNNFVVKNSLETNEIPRHDPALVKAVKELGYAANGEFASLKIVKIPNGVEYTIEEYDGCEHIAEKHRTWS